MTKVSLSFPMFPKKFTNFHYPTASFPKESTQPPPQHHKRKEKKGKEMYFTLSPLENPRITRLINIDI